MITIFWRDGTSARKRFDAFASNFIGQPTKLAVSALRKGVWRTECEPGEMCVPYTMTFGMCGAFVKSRRDSVTKFLLKRM